MQGTTISLKALGTRVAKWRAGCGGKRSRVPEDLWTEAVAVARTEGVYATSKATRFHYGKLKGRVAGAPEGRALVRTRPEFIEVAMPAVVSREAGGKTVVELEGRGGSRLRVEVTGPSAVDVVGLAQAFWSRDR